jgi:hypothetical protein
VIFFGINYKGGLAYVLQTLRILLLLLLVHCRLLETVLTDFIWSKWSWIYSKSSGNLLDFEKEKLVCKMTTLLKNKMNKILVTGAKGQLGSELQVLSKDCQFEWVLLVIGRN